MPKLNFNLKDKDLISKILTRYSLVYLVTIFSLPLLISIGKNCIEFISEALKVIAFALTNGFSKDGLLYTLSSITPIVIWILLLGFVFHINKQISNAARTKVLDLLFSAMTILAILSLSALISHLWLIGFIKDKEQENNIFIEKQNQAKLKLAESIDLKKFKSSLKVEKVFSANDLYCEIWKTSFTEKNFNNTAYLIYWPKLVTQKDVIVEWLPKNTQSYSCSSGQTSYPYSAYASQERVDYVKNTILRSRKSR